MLLSMTGYGKASCEYANRKITVEVKSLNSKQMDINTRIAAVYRDKELEIRNLVAQQLERGKVDFTLTVEEKGASGTLINQAVVANYYQQLQQVADNLHIAMPENILDTIMKLPDALKTDNATTSDDEWQAVQKVVLAALDQLTAFRTQEGRALQQMFDKKLERIGALLAEVEPFEKGRVQKIRDNIEKSLQDLSNDKKIDIDRNRFEQEMIFYIEKLDINEEKVRLRNHLKYFAETMQTEHAAGKKLGFIAQEMGREINTLGSKSNQSEMQIIVVKMKDELEQIKEQVLNVL
jgi:uncharacterized protein (TIGR00255 family)